MAFFIISQRNIPALICLSDQNKIQITFKEVLSMNEEKKIQLNLAIPERYRNLLRRMAAERIMENPGQIVSGASIATEMLLTALNEIGKTKKEGGNKE
jgi:hypothetical protein